MSAPIEDDIHDMGVGIEGLKGQLALHKQDRDALKTDVEKLKAENVSYLYPTAKLLEQFISQVKMVWMLTTLIGGGVFAIFMALFTAVLAYLVNTL
jgi:hypothetical protein